MRAGLAAGGVSVGVGSEEEAMSFGITLPLVASCAFPGRGSSCGAVEIMAEELCAWV